MLNSSGKLKLGGGGVNTLNEASILYGKGQNIKQIDYDNITVNPVIYDYPLTIEKIYSSNLLSSNKVSISTDAYYYKYQINSLFQQKLIPQSGIVLNNDSNISVDFSQSGWVNETSKLYTTINKIGIGTNNPIDSLHIKNNNAAIIIDNNINKFKFANNKDNYFCFGNDNGHNEIIENDIFFKEQFKIHRDAPQDALVINDLGTVAINCNININKDTYLTSNIYINNSNIINWLGTNGLVSSNYVSEIVNNMKPVDLTNLDYNNITNNRLKFLFPLTSNIATNEIGIDLINSIGFNKINSNIFTNNFKLGIGTNNPLGLIHIGSTSFSLDNTNANDGSLIISKTTSQNTRTLKFGFDNDFNFIIGNLNNNNNTWNSSIIIQPSAPNNCLIINNSGNLSLNNSLNINSNLILRGAITLNNFNISFNNNNFTLGNSLLILNNSGNIGIGTNPDNTNQLIVNGNIKTNNNIFGNNITVNNGTFQNINLSNITAYSLIQTSNFITSNLITRSLNILNSINTQNLISSNLITAKNISCSYLNVINDGIIDTGILNASSLISGLSLNITNDINSLSLSTSSITSTDFITSNANIIELTTTNINNSGSIICNGDINCTNITTSANIKVNGIIDTPSIIAITINGTNLNIKNLISSPNITSTNLTSANITTDNLNVNVNINTPSIKSTLINANNINSSTLATTGNITSAGTINGNLMTTNKIICINQIALNILNPIADLHIGNYSSSTINPSFVITYNENNFKMGYDNNNNFIFGTFIRQNSVWNNQIAINKNAPTNTININTNGNIGINKINSLNLYKFDVNGNLNATKLFQNNEAILTSNNIITLMNSNLSSYITSNSALTLFPTISHFNTTIDETINSLEDTISKSLSEENAVYTSKKRYPYGIITNNNLFSIPSTYYSSIYGIKEIITENIIVNNNITSVTYELYSSSTSGFSDKHFLFKYDIATPSFSINWGSSNYSSSTSTYQTSAASTEMNNSTFYNIGPNVPGFNKIYKGDFLIFKFNEPIILTKYAFYIANEHINSAPGNWVCFAANDITVGNVTTINNWTYIPDASIGDDIQLISSSYSRFNQTLLSYQKTVNMGNNQYQYYAFVFNKLIYSFLNPGNTLKLTRVELFGKSRIQVIYTTSNLLYNTLNNYSTVDQLNQKLNKNVSFTYPLMIDQYYQNISLDTSVLINSSSDQYLLSNLIVGYIQNQTAAWKPDALNSDNIYYSYPGCIGIGTTRPNINNIIDVKLHVNGRINTNNINVLSNINATNFIGDGSLITNIDYNNITLNKPDFKNINNWNIDTTSKNIYNTNTGNVAIGFSFGNSLISKFNVNGNIYTTGTIIANAIQENGILISNKYLSSATAEATYFKITGGNIIGNVGINTANNQGNQLYVNGNIRSSGIINGNILQENGIDLSIKYLSLTDATNNYLSKTLGGTISGNIIINEKLAVGGAAISQNYKLNVNGSIFSSNVIYATSNFIEGGVNLIDKYLTISNASDIYLSNTNGIIKSNLTINSNLGVGTSATSDYRLNVNGNFNATNIYNNGNLIDFNSYYIKTDIDAKFLLYPTLIYLNDNYLTISSFNSTISDYTKTGLDLNYLNINNGGNVNGLTTFFNLNSSNINISNILNVSNILTSNNLNVLNTIITSNIISSNIDNIQNISSSNIYSSNLYINGILINFNSYAIQTDIDNKFLLYPTFTYIDNTYLPISTFNSTIADYTKTGLDLNYLNVNNGGNVSGLTTFLNLNSSNINISNILNSSNLFSSNINVFNLNVGSSKIPLTNSIYKLNVEGNLNAAAIYSNNIPIDFNSYATTSLLNSSLNNYLTSNFISNNYVSNSILDARLLLYSQTGADPNYLKLSDNNIVSGNINFIGAVNSINLSNASNLYSSNLYSSNLIVYSNLAINTNISSSYRLNVNGSIYSSNNIHCAGNFNENGLNLIDKYLTINNATLNYLPLNGGTIINNLGIGTTTSPSFRLNVNGSIYSSNNIICAGNFNENGLNLIDKYLTINNASLNYLPLNGGTIKTSLTVTNNLGIGISASPAFKLTVNGTIYSTDNIYENGITLSQKYLSISDGGTISGNIGIGTSSSPLYRLNVNGSIYSSNSVISGGDMVENGVKLSDKYLSIANASQYLITGDFLNNQPNLQKKIGFKFVCNKPIILNNETYYKHDINISTYVRNKYDIVDMSNYRIFNIKCFSTLGVFTTMTANKPPNILQYDVYMSSYPSINICAIGFPSNYYLNKITAGDICLLKTTNYNYISVVSKINNTSISCIISDFLF